MEWFSVILGTGSSLALPCRCGFWILATVRARGRHGRADPALVLAVAYGTGREDAARASAPTSPRVGRGPPGCVAPAAPPEPARALSAGPSSHSSIALPLHPGHLGPPLSAVRYTDTSAPSGPFCPQTVADSRPRCPWSYHMRARPTALDATTNSCPEIPLSRGGASTDCGKGTVPATAPVGPVRGAGR